MRLLYALFMVIIFSTSAFAKVNVVATLPFIGSLANEIGGDRIEVTTLVKPNQDPHYVEAKPSMILAASKADIIMYNGLDLEVGYLPLIIQSSRNPRIQAGQKGNHDCSLHVNAIEKPTADVDRSMGDVHPLGNPHYLKSPKNIARVVEGMADALSAVDPSNEAFYKERLAAFKERFKKKEAEWSGIRLKGKKFIAYHRDISYLEADFGFQVIGYIEPKPGISPSAAHLEKLVETMKRERPDAVIISTATQQGRQAAEFLSKKTGVKVAVIPSDVGSTEQSKDWFSFMDQILASLK